MTARLTKSEFAAPRTAAIDITDQVQRAPSAQTGRPSAWLHIDGSRSITAAQKHSMENHQGAPGRRLAAQYPSVVCPGAPDAWWCNSLPHLLCWICSR